MAGAGCCRLAARHGFGGFVAMADEVKDLTVVVLMKGELPLPAVAKVVRGRDASGRARYGVAGGALNGTSGLQVAGWSELLTPLPQTASTTFRDGLCAIQGKQVARHLEGS